MDRRLSLTALHHSTSIPVPTLSMYVNGHRNISANHRPLIAAILSVPVDDIVGYCTTEVIVLTPVEPAPELDEEPSHPPASPEELWR